MQLVLAPRVRLKCYFMCENFCLRDVLNLYFRILHVSHWKPLYFNFYLSQKCRITTWGFSKLGVRTQQWLTGAPPPSTAPQYHSHRLDLMSWGSQCEREIFQIWYPQREKLPNPLELDNSLAPRSAVRVLSKYITGRGRGWGTKRTRNKQKKKGCVRGSVVFYLRSECSW